jgi:single-stranded DNA-binding protein
MSQEAAKPKENEGLFVGKAEYDTHVQYTEKGTAKAELQVVRTESWTSGDGSQKSEDVHIKFKFFGKPAEWLEKQNVLAGEQVKVTYSLRSFEGRDYETKAPNGTWKLELKGFRVDVVGRASNTPANDKDIEF